MLCMCKDTDTNGAARVIIQADTTPAEFPLTGAEVEGMSDAEAIAPGSMMYCVDTGKTYFMNETGDGWNAWGGNA